MPKLYGTTFGGRAPIDIYSELMRQPQNQPVPLRSRDVPDNPPGDTEGAYLPDRGSIDAFIPAGPITEEEANSEADARQDCSNNPEDCPCTCAQCDHWREMQEEEAEKAARGPEILPQENIDAAYSALKKAADAADIKIAVKLMLLADTLQKDIDHNRREMTQAPTRKREQEYAGRLREADRFERAQTIARRLARQLEAGDAVPVTLPTRLSKDLLLILASIVSPPRNGESRYSAEYMYGPDVYAGRDYYSPWGMKTVEEVCLFRAWYEAGDSPDKSEAAKQRELEAQERKLAMQQIPGFFPTPPKLVELLLHLADIRHGHNVLEPSAGSGAIADEIRRQYPDCTLICVEWNHSLRELLKAKGHKVIERQTDFLQFTDPGGYDRIVMNPPFEQMADTLHVQHAYQLLKPGGRLVSIMAPVDGIQRKKAFREWLDERDANVYPNEPDAFSKGLRTTGVQTITVVIDKPGG